MEWIFSCKEHVEEAIEEAIDDEGFPPELALVPEQEKTEKVCFICEHSSTYMVKKVIR
ncbi:CxxH/CxxC protein [Salipaludibacillus neizhouensis]|nr:CxxH/CxxC protein [Salipaludibacillus neizhouensis]